MNINISIIGQAITFGILIWVTMKYVWPPLLAAIDKRNQEISEGLDAAAQGKQQLAEAASRREELEKEGVTARTELIGEGKRQRDDIVAKAAGEAEGEREKIVAAGRKQIEQERQAMVRELQANYANLVVAGASKIIRKEISADAHKKIVDDLVKQI